jgi:ADP-ribose pyrophosphatase YjhB (NUDIX family)
MDGYIKWIRDHVGSQKILVVYATVCIVDDAGRLLWQRRGDFGWWGLPGGVLELDEDLATCAVREAAEETGLAVEVTDLVGVYTSPDYDVHYPNGDEVQQITYCFRASVTGGSLHADRVETMDLRWLPPEEIPDTAVWYRHMAEDLFAARSDASFATGSPGETRPGEPYFKLIRRHIGQDPFVAAAAIAAVFDDDDRLLIVRRSDDGTWSLPGGMVELGERIDQTVISEVREETGLEIEPVRLIGVHSNADYIVRFPHGDVVKAASCLFRCRITGGTLEVDQDEIIDARFCKKDELPDLPTRYKDRVAAAFEDAVKPVIS